MDLADPAWLLAKPAQTARLTIAAAIVLAELYAGAYMLSTQGEYSMALTTF